MTGLIAACLSALLTELIALSKMAILLNNKLLKMNTEGHDFLLTFAKF